MSRTYPGTIGLDLKPLQRDCLDDLQVFLRLHTAAVYPDIKAKIH